MTNVKPPPKHKATIGGYLKRTWMLYAMLILPAAFFIIFRYVPMVYVWVAFTDWNLFQPSLWQTPFVGLDWFRHAFALHDFWPAIRNTLTLNVLDLIFGFPAPIILALLLNELKFKFFKRFAQTVLYMPFFISWVVVGGMAIQLFATNLGMINQTFDTSIPFMTQPWHWVATYIGLGIWKSAGFGTIIYLAAISGINPELYEASDVDGASRFQKIIYVTIPCLMPTIIILLILNVGSMVGIEFDRPFVLGNPAVFARADVISTWVFRRAFLNFQYSLATAVSVFQSVINVALLVTANVLARRAGERGLF